MLAGMPTPQVRALVGSGKIDVLIPLGALEQHGPHLPLGTDTVIAEAVCHAVAVRVQDLVVAPCLPVGCSDHHLSFPGTASIPASVVVAYIKAHAETLLGHGFRHVYLSSGHAGNLAAMKEATDSLPLEIRGRVAAFVDWPDQRDAMHKWAKSALGIGPQQVGSHAGHFETSIMLALCPESVDMGAAPEGFIGSISEASQTMSRSGMAALSEVGVIGDARDASAEAGKGYLEILINSVATFIEDHRATGAT